MHGYFLTHLQFTAVDTVVFDVIPYSNQYQQCQCWNKQLKHSPDWTTNLHKKVRNGHCFGISLLLFTWLQLELSYKCMALWVYSKPGEQSFSKEAARVALAVVNTPFCRRPAHPRAHQRHWPRTGDGGAIECSLNKNSPRRTAHALTANWWVGRRVCVFSCLPTLVVRGVWHGLATLVDSIQESWTSWVSKVHIVT